MSDTESQLIELAASCDKDPEKWSRMAFDWGHGELADYSGPRQWQIEAFEEIRDHLSNPKTRFQPLMLARASGHGIGKAHPLSMPVETPGGLRRWGDIKPGDQVFGMDGRPVLVLARRDYLDAPLVRVTFDDRSSVVCSTGHLWRVKGRNDRRTVGGWRTLDAQEIANIGVKRSNGVALARQWEIPAQGAAEYQAAPVLVHPYVLGVWLGDGGRNKGSITSDDSEVLEKLRSIGQVSIGNKQGTTASTIGIYGLKPKLRAIGVLEKYSYEKSVPVEYLRNDIETRSEILRGLLDTDGECTPGGAIVFGSTSLKLAEDVVWLARSLGGKARMQPTAQSPTYPGANGEKLNGRPCYRCTVTMPEGFKAFYIERKQNRLRKVQARYITRWIDGIEPVPTEPSMCIEVEGGLYLADAFAVTHNSAFIGMVTNWALSTCDDCKVVVTANTDTQLRTKTSPEIGKWARLAITSHWFEPASASISSKDKEHAKTWRADFVPWSEHNTEAFAGLHNKGKRIVLIFDEASAISDKVWEVAEGALTDEDTEIIWIAFGNPTRNTGRFRECFRRFKHRWKAKQIDSRTVDGTNKEQIAKWAADYGEDSDFFKVRVRGMFPSMSSRQYISEVDVSEAYGKVLRPESYNFAAKILTVDPAWEGDDEFVIGLRQGLAFSILATYQKNDNDLVMAQKIAQFEDEHKADAVFIDAGFGTGIVSAGKGIGRDWTLVWFASASGDIGCINKRAEMWKGARDWLKAGGALPPDATLRDELQAPEIVPRIDGKLQIESKKDMKARGIPSPNRADALVLSFAFPVMKRDPLDAYRIKGERREYNPYE